MTGWLTCGVYIAGFIICYRFAYLYLYADLNSVWPGHMNASDKRSCAILASFIALLWPAATIIGGLGWVALRLSPKPPAQRLQELQERRAAQIARDHEIGKLERELGISERRP